MQFLLFYERTIMKKLIIRFASFLINKFSDQVLVDAAMHNDLLELSKSSTASSVKNYQFRIDNLKSELNSYHKLYDEACRECLEYRELIGFLKLATTSEKAS